MFEATWVLNIALWLWSFLFLTSLAYPIFLITTKVIGNRHRFVYLYQMMRMFYTILCLTFLACEAVSPPETSTETEKLNDRKLIQLPDSSYVSGRSYLSIYSNIYTNSQHRKHELTVTVSLRNVNDRDTIYILNADFHDTHGKKLKSYLDHAIVIEPLETVEMVIEESDNSGGSGASFIFGWSKKENSIDPFFEAVMISTQGQQGLSFTTQGRKIE